MPETKQQKMSRRWKEIKNSGNPNAITWNAFQKNSTILYSQFILQNPQVIDIPAMTADYKENKAYLTIAKLSQRRTNLFKSQDSAFNSAYKYQVYETKKLIPKPDPTHGNIAYDPEVLVDLVKNNRDIFNDLKKQFKYNTRDGQRKMYFSFTFSYTSDSHPEVREKTVPVGPAELFGSDNVFQFRNFFIKGLEQAVNATKEIYGGGYILSMNRITISSTKYSPITGKSYCALPDLIKNKKAIINIKNEDNYCFLYSVLCYLNPINSNPERVARYVNLLKTIKYTTAHFIDGVDVFSHHIGTFEKANNLNINIYTSNDDGKNIRPLRLSKHNSETMVPLFYHKKHYSLIKSFSRFCGLQGSHYRYCHRCLKSFTQIHRFNEHMEDCNGLDVIQKVVMPPKDKNIERFTKFRHQNKMPIVIYGDFEAINKSMNNDDNMNDMKKTKHESVSYRFYIVSTFDLGRVKLDYEFVGEKANEHFVKTIMTLEKILKYKLKDQKEKYADYMHPLTNEEKLNIEIVKLVDFVTVILLIRYVIMIIIQDIIEVVLVVNVI
jgi:hypothetical protein